MRHMDEGRLQAWLDGPAGGLSDQARSEVAAHVAGCAECAARVEALQASDARVRDLLDAVAESEGDIPDFSAVVARARDHGADGTPGLEPGSGPKAGPDTDGPRPRRVAPAWAASILVALGAGWLWNEMTRTGMEPGLVRPEVGAVPSVGEELDPAAGEVAVDSVQLVPEVRVLASPEPGDEAASEADETTAPARAGEVEAETPAAPSPAGAASDMSRAPAVAGGAADASDTPQARSRVRIPPEWRPMTLAEAEAFAGFRPRTVPGLTVVSVSAMGFMGDRAVVRVVQRLPAGEELVLLQFASARAAAGWEPAVVPLERTTDTAGAASVALPGGVLVSGRAPVGSDSVRVLLERLH